MKGKGLMLVMGGSPKKGPPMMGHKDEEEAEASSASDTLAGEAFDAFQDGDREGFIAAFKSAVRACGHKPSADSYDEDDDSEDF